MPASSTSPRAPPTRASARAGAESAAPGAALRSESATVAARYRGRRRSPAVLAGDHDVHARLADVAAGVVLVAVVNHELDAVGVAGLEVEAVHVPARLGAPALVRQRGRGSVAACAEVPVVLRRVVVRRDRQLVALGAVD